MPDRQVRLDNDDVRALLARVDQTQQSTVMLAKVAGSPGATIPAYFTVQPVAFASDTPAEGTAATLVDKGGTFLAFLLGSSPPSRDDLVTLRLVNGKWIGEVCCGSRSCCLCIKQLALPVGASTDDLTLTFSTMYGPSSSYALHFIPGSGCAWLSDCIDMGDETSMKIRYRGGASTWALTIDWYTDSHCGALDALSGCGFVGDFLFDNVVELSGNPFHVRYGQGSSPFFFCPRLASAGVTDVYLDQDSGPQSCSWRVQVKGCGGHVISGALVEMIQSGSTFASGTTGADGFVSVDFTDHEGATGVTYRVTATGHSTLTGSLANCNLVPGFLNLSAAPGWCCQNFNVTGCNGLPLAGAVVKVYDHDGGTELGTATTDGTGTAYILWNGSCSAFVTATHPSGRFAAYGATQAMTSGNSTDIPMAAATGYHCLAALFGCVYPEPDTLHATHPVFGALTFTFAGGSWTSTKSYSFPGFGACSATTVTVTSSWSPFSYTESWNVSGDCPDDSGMDPVTVDWTATAGTCAPSFTGAFNHTPATAAERAMYQRATAMTLGMSE